MNVQEVRLYLDKQPHLANEVVLGQGDSKATTVRASIYDGAQPLDPTGLTAYFCMLLPDRRHYYREPAALAGNVATVTVDERHAACVAGSTEVAYFQLLRGSDVVASTSRFRVRVLRSALDGMVPAENWDSAIEDLLARGRGAIEECERAAADVLGRADAGDFDGFSPIARVDETDTGSRITVTDRSGTTTADVYVPTARVDETDTGARISITDASGSTSADVYVPTARVDEVAGGLRVRVTDRDGATEATVRDATIPSVTARVGSSVGTPDVVVTMGGTPNARTFDLAFSGLKGERGNVIWTATADPTAPDYTFGRSDLTGPGGREPSAGDLVMRGSYRYTVESVGDGDVLTSHRAQLWDELTAFEVLRAADGMLWGELETGVATSSVTMQAVLDAIGLLLWNDIET